MLLDVGLHEDRALLGVEAGGEEVDRDLAGVLLDELGAVVERGERVPVGYEEVGLILVLKPDPVRQRALEIAQMQQPRRLHPRKQSWFAHSQSA